ncbi:MAG TPA: phosphatidylglycerol lysyltransferase domain-containing protein, partial [Ideonella sp.]|nr:phosphatidylglycerol lysyltransferase domain-containing protein [Ideonella sp.]
TALSYLALTGYDASALRYAGASVGRGTVLLTSYVAYALGNTIGLGPLTGGAVRMRLYAAAGVEPPKIARAIVFNAAAFGLGMTAFGALGLLWAAGEVAPQLRLPAALLRSGAALALAGLLGFLVLCARRRQLRWRRWSLRLPAVGLALRQLAIGALELSFSAAALWFLLPDGEIALPSFVAFYAIAVTAGILSHVPGGLGVFEAVMLAACGPHVPVHDVLGALLLYRGLYHVLPLVVATGLLALYELRSGIAAPVGRMAVHLSPQLLAALACVGGVWLLVSGVTPQSDGARQLLALKVPLAIVEASHFVGSVAGLGLLLVARGLLHRLDAAWWAALGLSLLAAVLAWPKGIALNEALLLGTLAVLLVISRRQFDRRSSLFAERLEPEWLLAVGGVLAGCLGILFFAYQEVGYANRLWWQFEFDGQAPRSLRALLAAALLGLAYSGWQLLRPPSGAVAQPDEAELARAAAIVRASPQAEACFALTGDKHLMFSDSGRSFLMFGKQSRSWISLHGPFGDPAEAADLVWRFVERAGAHGGRVAFYQVRPQSLPMYLD